MAGIRAAIVATWLLAASAAAMGQAGTLDLQAPGNLASLNAIGCVSGAQLRNTWTAADLYRATSECVRAERYAEAVFLSALAGAYARYDSMRVADPTAREAEAAVRMRYMGDLDTHQQRAFFEELSKTAANAGKLAALCEDARRIGPPDYTPTYMIQHGLAAFSAAGEGDGLVAGFDGAVAWETALTGFLHCQAKAGG